MKSLKALCDEEESRRIAVWFLYVIIVAIVLVAAISGWGMNSKLEQAREERVERPEKRVGKLEGR